MKDFRDPPFPYFGNKKYIASTVWELFGDVKRYIEPFAGALGCLLYRPEWHTKFYELVNDVNGYLVNAWRSVKNRPDETAHHAADMFSEADYHAKWRYLQAYDWKTLAARLENEPEYCEPKIGAWWIQVSCMAIGDATARMYNDESTLTSIPAIASHKGIYQYYADVPSDMTGMEYNLRKWFNGLAKRLSNVKVCCGGWEKVLTPSLVYNRDVGIFFDPPYAGVRNVYNRYSTPVSADVEAWIIENYKPPLKVILCGYGAEHDGLLALGWGKRAWKAHYGMNGKTGKVKVDTRDEQLWLSPTISPAANSLLLGGVRHEREASGLYTQAGLDRRRCGAGVLLEGDVVYWGARR
ncbi:MAG: DNA adenine methylase [Synergistaceae bacterium]|jgi:site-specific DNA-adenine methylase|nr:DNA adenine methylase [Synergistaceae bacterium]